MKKRCWVLIWNYEENTPDFQEAIGFMEDLIIGYGTLDVRIVEVDWNWGSPNITEDYKIKRVLPLQPKIVIEWIGEEF